MATFFVKTNTTHYDFVNIQFLITVFAHWFGERIKQFLVFIVHHNIL